MSAYVDSSALLKLYVEEPASDVARDILQTAGRWTSGMHTLVEVRRALARILERDELAEARGRFHRHWERMDVVELDSVTCERAAELAEQTGARTLDALHLGAADRAGAGTLGFVTFDVRQAEAARTLGWSVLGA